MAKPDPEATASPEAGKTLENVGLENLGPLLLIGCGKMGGALLRGWLARGVRADRIIVVEPDDQARAAFDDLGVTLVAKPEDLAANTAPAVILLAVKPQQSDAVVSKLSRFAGPKAVFLSIIAGRSLAYLEGRLGPGAAPGLAIVRSMPNTPAAVGRGITVLCANAKVAPSQRAVYGALLAAVGGIAWIEDEALLDPVTALSGGGPAYVFLLVECLAQAGIEAGLPEDLAMRLARETVSGSGELLRLAEAPAATLRANVTSPGGTTQEALKVLMARDGLQALMTRAIAEATRRSRDLA